MKKQGLGVILSAFGKTTECQVITVVEKHLRRLVSITPVLKTGSSAAACSGLPPVRFWAPPWAWTPNLLHTCIKQEHLDPLWMRIEVLVKWDSELLHGSKSSQHRVCLSQRARICPSTVWQTSRNLKSQLVSKHVCCVQTLLQWKKKKKAFSNVVSKNKAWNCSEVNGNIHSADSCGNRVSPLHFKCLMLSC